MGRNVRIVKKRDKKKESLAMLFVVVLMVGFIGVWLYQIQSLFSQEAMDGYEERSAVTSGQIQDGMDMKDELNEDLAITDSGAGSIVEAVKDAIAAELEEKSLQELAEEMLRQMEVEALAEDTDEITEDTDLSDPPMDIGELEGVIEETNVVQEGLLPSATVNIDTQTITE